MKQLFGRPVGRILVATPCYGGNATVPYLKSIQAIAAEHHHVDILVTEGESNINRGRNEAAATFFHETAYQTLAFIDADIEITPEAFEQIRGIDSPIRGAAVCKKKTDAHGDPVDDDLSCYLMDGRQFKRGGSEPLECKYLGSAVMLIERQVIEWFFNQPGRIYKNSGRGMGAAIFECMIVDGDYLTEDYGFCHDAREAGFKIMVDPLVKVSHYGTGVWRG